MEGNERISGADFDFSSLAEDVQSAAHVETGAYDHTRHERVWAAAHFMGLMAFATARLHADGGRDVSLLSNS